jgi:hypothetical protein
MADQLWLEIGKRAGIRAEMRKNLMKVGRERGSDPKQWYGTMNPIRIDYTCIESLSGFREWVQLDKLIPVYEDAAQFNVEVQAIESEQLKELALAAYQQKRGSNGATDNPDFLSRICVNYIRHKLTTYERYLEIASAPYAKQSHNNRGGQLKRTPNPAAATPPKNA